MQMNGKSRGEIFQHVGRALMLFTLCGLCAMSCTRPVAIEFGQVCRSENDSKYISVEGYLRTGASVLCSSRDGTRTCGLELSDTPNGESVINAHVEEGTGSSQMEALPKSYGSDSLKLRTQDASLVGPADRLRVTGTARTAADVANASTHTVCFIDVDKIEKP